MQSKVATVEQYLSELPADRRQVVQAVRTVMKRNLAEGFEEVMQYGMIGYCVPHKLFPQGYHCDPKQPLPFAALAAQKNYYSIYLMALAEGSGGEATFRAAWEKTGRSLDMGKCCVRFRRLEDVALDVLATTLKRITVDAYVSRYLGNLAALDARAAKGPPAAAPAAKAAKTAKPASTAKPVKATSAKSTTPTKAAEAAPTKPAAKAAVKPAAAKAVAAKAVALKPAASKAVASKPAAAQAAALKPAAAKPAVSKPAAKAALKPASKPAVKAAPKAAAKAAPKKKTARGLFRRRAARDARRTARGRRRAACGGDGRRRRGA